MFRTAPGRLDGEDLARKKVEAGATRVTPASGPSLPNASVDADSSREFALASQFLVSLSHFNVDRPARLANGFVSSSPDSVGWSSALACLTGCSAIG